MKFRCSSHGSPSLFALLPVSKPLQHQHVYVTEKGLVRHAMMTYSNVPKSSTTRCLSRKDNKHICTYIHCYLDFKYYISASCINVFERCSVIIYLLINAINVIIFLTVCFLVRHGTEL